MEFIYMYTRWKAYKLYNYLIYVRKPCQLNSGLKVLFTTRGKKRGKFFNSVQSLFSSTTYNTFLLFHVFSEINLKIYTLTKQEEYKIKIDDDF